MAVCSFPKLAEQDQDQDDNEYEAGPAAAVVAGPVEATAPSRLKPPSSAITKMMSRMVPSDMAISHWLDVNLIRRGCRCTARPRRCRFLARSLGTLTTGCLSKIERSRRPSVRSTIVGKEARLRDACFPLSGRPKTSKRGNRERSAGDTAPSPSIAI